MSDDTKKTDVPDWNNLAREALDLWQDHLTSYANDPQAKEELIKVVAPMNKMFADWTSMMQQGLQAATQKPRTQEKQTEAAQQEDGANEQPKQQDQKEHGSHGTAPSADAGIDRSESFGSTVSASSDAAIKPEEPIITTRDPAPEAAEAVVPQSAPITETSAVAPTDGDGRVDELADRVASLKRQLADLESQLGKPV